MQLSKETIDLISKVTRVAKILNIEGLIFDQECVRGHHQQEGSMIIHRDNLPKFEFASLGISRVPTLISRLALLGDNYTVEAQEKDKTQTEKVVTKLILANKKTEVEFKCGDPAMMQKAPKNLKDPQFFAFKVDNDTVTTLAKAQSALRGETISLTGSKNGVIAKLSDVEGDMMNHIVSEDLDILPDADKDKFYFSYKNKLLIALLKEAMDSETVQIIITKRGMLRISVNGINVIIAPEL
jgi:hypothetical protein